MVEVRSVCLFYQTTTPKNESEIAYMLKNDLDICNQKFTMFYVENLAGHVLVGLFMDVRLSIAIIVYACL